MAQKNTVRATTPVAEIPGVSSGFSFGFDLSATEAVGYTKGLNAVFGAYSEYEAGKMRELAFNHQAAMAEINARQVEIETQFVMAEKMDQLRETLAMQNVIAAATGRQRAGSVSAIEQTSRAKQAEEFKRLKVTGKGKKVAEMMTAGTQRAAGKAAYRQGLLRVGSTAIEEGIDAARYLV